MHHAKGAAPAWGPDLLEVLPQARLGEPLSGHTTWRIGGPADAFVEARTPRELAAAVRFAKQRSLPLFMLGWGSNLLVLDGGVRGLVVRLGGDFERLERLDGTRVRAGAAVRIPKLVTFCADACLAGSEPLVGVPGTVGGALVMNAGTREGEIGPLVREVTVLEADGKEVPLGAEDIGFSYRKSTLQGRVLTSAVLELNVGDKADIMARVQALQQRRLQTQPVHTRNVGSVFKNPPGSFAARLIEEAGMKGEGLGGARVSPLHANFIENVRDASAKDVLALIERVRARVREKHGVALETEVQVVGEA